jgi:hypothetical protein
MADVITPQNQPVNTSERTEPVAEPKPKMTRRKILILIFVAIILFGFSLPSGSSTTEGIVFWGIFLFGIFLATTAMTTELRKAKFARNTYVKVFMIVGGIGIGVVLFIVMSVVAAISAISKNPDSLQCG